MDFEALSPSTLQHYLHQWGIVPPLSLITSTTPPLPSTLLQQMVTSSTEQQTATPANRPRRDPNPKELQNHRRFSSQSLESDNIPVMADVDGVHQVYAAIAEQHFQHRPVLKEVEVLTNFLVSASRSHGKFTV